MSKAVLISIRPKWCELIASGKKTIEIRKTRPQIKTPFKCYIYETRGFERVGNDNLNCVIGGNGRSKVIGEFVCDRITDIHLTDEGYDFDVLKMTCLKYEEMEAYLCRKNGYGWHISALKIYDKPKELSEFMQCHKCEYYSGCKEHEYGCNGAYKVTRPPQSFMYVEELP